MLTYLEAVVAASDVAEVWAIHTDKMAQYGFTRLLYGFTRFRSNNSYGDPDDLVVLSNIGGKFLETYVSQGLYRSAPMVRWAFQNAGACSWRVVGEAYAKGELSPEEQDFIAFASPYGMNSGYTISFKETSSRTKGCIGLGADPSVSQDEVDEIWARHGQELEVLNNIAHMRIVALPYSSYRRPLTLRQREVLEWVGEGKTTLDIATIMSVTPATVEKHLRLARETLNVTTTAQAVLKATLQNQIFVGTPFKDPIPESRINRAAS